MPHIITVPILYDSHIEYYPGVGMIVGVWKENTDMHLERHTMSSIPQARMRKAAFDVARKRSVEKTRNMLAKMDLPSLKSPKATLTPLFNFDDDDTKTSRPTSLRTKPKAAL